MKPNLLVGALVAAGVIGTGAAAFKGYIDAPVAHAQAASAAVTAAGVAAPAANPSATTLPLNGFTDLVKRYGPAVVNVSGGGTINLKTEEMDTTLKPQPKDSGVGSLRTPLHVRGTFGDPKVGPDMGKLAARSAGAIAMGILNPLLAVLPLIEEGKGKDSNCGQLIAQAAASTKKAATSSGQSAASGATAPRPPSRSKR